MSHSITVDVTVKHCRTPSEVIRMPFSHIKLNAKLDKILPCVLQTFRSPLVWFHIYGDAIVRNILHSLKALMILMMIQLYR